MVKVFVTGKRHPWHDDVTSRLAQRIHLMESAQDQSDITLAFCTVASRVGTDIEAAMRNVPANKPAILVVFHHTFDPDFVMPRTSRFAARDDVLVVDIMFTEDEGITRNLRNDEALKKVSDRLLSLNTFPSEDPPAGNQNIHQSQFNTILLVALLCVFAFVVVVGLIVYFALNQTSNNGTYHGPSHAPFWNQNQPT